MKKTGIHRYRYKKTAVLTAAALLLSTTLGAAQQPAPGRAQRQARAGAPQQMQADSRLHRPLSEDSNAISDETRIGPDDLLEVTVFGAEELARTVRVSSSGEISLPLIGMVVAAGRTPNELEREIEARLAGRFMHDPQVSVFLKELNSQGVAVFGAVAKPGVYQLRGPSSVVEVLSLAGGLAEDAGDRVLVTRSAVHRTGEGLPAVVETDLKELLQSGDPALDLPVWPGDIVRVPRAGIVYVIGEVRKPGGFLLRSNENISVLQALALAEGLLRTAARGRARIIRSDPADGARHEIPMDLGRILAGKAPDPQLQPRDIVFVPNSAARGAFYRGTEAALGIVSGLIVFRR
jgi:polysaccharide export outer membrane protein